MQRAIRPAGRSSSSGPAVGRFAADPVDGKIAGPQPRLSLRTRTEVQQRAGVRQADSRSSRPGNHPAHRGSGKWAPARLIQSPRNRIQASGGLRASGGREGEDMKISERCAQNPAAVAAAAAIVLLFGMLALMRLPIQLLPDTRQPQLLINAEWREAAPSRSRKPSSSPSRRPCGPARHGRDALRVEPGRRRRRAHLRGGHRHDARHAGRRLAPQHAPAPAPRCRGAAGVRRRQLAGRRTPARCSCEPLPGNGSRTSPRSTRS